MLIAPALLDELGSRSSPPLARRLRTTPLGVAAARCRAAAAVARLDEARRAFAVQLLEGFLGLDGWQKAGRSRPSSRRPRSRVRRYVRAGSCRIPRRRSAPRRLVRRQRDRGPRSWRPRHAELVELLRASGIPLGLLTNGRQFRLVHAGPDYDAWAEWDAQTWFDESEGRETLRGLTAILRGEDWTGAVDRLRALIADDPESRDRQGDLAQVLGEQVRQASSCSWRGRPQAGRGPRPTRSALDRPRERALALRRRCARRALPGGHAHRDAACARALRRVT